MIPIFCDNSRSLINFDSFNAESGGEGRGRVEAGARGARETVGKGPQDGQRLRRLLISKSLQVQYTFRLHKMQLSQTNLLHNEDYFELALFSITKHSTFPLN